MKYNYCTVFDQGFLNRGLALHYSLLKNNFEDFRHFILCVDDLTYEVLTTMDLPKVVAIKLQDVELSDPKIQKAKLNRNYKEYMWTLSSVFTYYVFTHYQNLEYITYLDADLYFYSSPERVIQDMGESSILIIPHNLPSKENEDLFGKYNVGMVIFKDDKNGDSALSWWKNECLAWCYDEAKNGKYGDQKYLDHFEEKFDGVMVYKQKGAGLAGWNIKNYRGKIKRREEDIFIDGDILIFFHFSQWKQYYPDSRILPYGPLSAYRYSLPLSFNKRVIYNEYAQIIYLAMAKIREIIPNFISGVIPRPNLFIQIYYLTIPYTLSATKKIVRKFIKKLARKFRPC